MDATALILDDRGVEISAVYSKRGGSELIKREDVAKEGEVKREGRIFKRGSASFICSLFLQSINSGLVGMLVLSPSTLHFAWFLSFFPVSPFSLVSFWAEGLPKEEAPINPRFSVSSHAGL